MNEERLKEIEKRIPDPIILDLISELRTSRTMVLELGKRCYRFRGLLVEARAAMDVAPTCLQTEDQDLWEKTLERIDLALK